MVWRERTIERKIKYPSSVRPWHDDTSNESDSHFLKIDPQTGTMPAMNYPVGWSADMHDLNRTR